MDISFIQNKFIQRESFDIHPISNMLNEHLHISHINAKTRQRNKQITFILIIILFLVYGIPDMESYFPILFTRFCQNMCSYSQIFTFFTLNNESHQ